MSMDLAKRMPRRMQILVLFLAVISAGYFLWELSFATDSHVPGEFLEANKEGALVANVIVSLSRQSAGSIGKIGELDKEGKNYEAAQLVAEELKKSEELRQKAYELALLLGKMTEVLPEISPRAATEAAMRAINFETSLIIRLINYQKFLNELLTVLNNRLAGGVVKPEVIEQVVEKINNEAAAVNDLNEQYKAAVEEFEKIVRQS